MTPNASKQGKFGSLGAIFLFIFLPCMWGLGLQKESPCACFCLISGRAIMVWKSSRSPKHIAMSKFLRSYLSPLFLPLGREPCGDRILRSCLQKAPATARSNLACNRHLTEGLGELCFEYYKNRNLKFKGRIFPRTLRPLQNVSPHHHAAEKQTSWHGRPRFLVRMSMIQRVLEKLCPEKSALTVWPLISSPTKRTMLCCVLFRVGWGGCQSILNLSLSDLPWGAYHSSTNLCMHLSFFEEFVCQVVAVTATAF